MNEELMQQVGGLQTKVDNMRLPEVSRRAVAPFLDLPALVGCWYAGHVQRSTGDMPNSAPYISGASSQDLSYNGNPTLNYTDTGVAYWDYDGTGDYHSVADNTDLDILGTEVWAAQPGLTVGGWFRFDALATRGVVGKWNDVAVNQRSYLILLNSSDIRFFISADGTALVSATSTYSISTGQWYFLVGRFIPSTSVSIFVNNVKTTNTVSIPASIYNSNSTFSLPQPNAGGGAAYLDGLFSVGFLCASALSDATIQSIFQQTRSLYGV